MENTFKTLTWKVSVENLNESNHQLLQTIEELKAENVKLRLFINIATHELRTPIMPIVGYSEILQDIGERREIKGIIYNAKRLDQQEYQEIFWKVQRLKITHYSLIKSSLT